VNVLLIPANIISDQLEELEESKEGIIFAQERIRELENNLLFLYDLLNDSLMILHNQMKEKQQFIFFTASKILSQKEMSLNKLSEKLAEKLNLSFSTIKWNITRLRDLGLFESNGQRGNTKTTIMLTQLGASLYSNFAQSKKIRL